MKLPRQKKIGLPRKISTPCSSGAPCMTTTSAPASTSACVQSLSHLFGSSRSAIPSEKIVLNDLFPNTWLC